MRNKARKKDNTVNEMLRFFSVGALKCPVSLKKTGPDGISTHSKAMSDNPICQA